MGPLTYLQLFGIGLSFGFAGPCFLSCTPILIAYLAGRTLKWGRGLAQVSLFLSARLFAYLILGYLAGFSATLLRRFGNSVFVLYLKPLGGIIVIVLGILVFFAGGQDYCRCRIPANKTVALSSLIILGFTIGLLPCAPLLALLFEITIISKSAFQGMLFALAFGLGTFISNLLVIAGLSGIISWFPAKVLKSSLGLSIFRFICAVLLVLMGLNFILFRP
ncbi:MAG: sulfite exporter TauE/SafE family protein [Candidatus Omnitrophica bacterium]|nr:sulfite exporter TauE/SafE family protein [Candidatus Omnitrophota bacterium]